MKISHWILIGIILCLAYYIYVNEGGKHGAPVINDPNSKPVEGVKV